MREIKFRGKRIDSKEWVYGQLVKMQNPYVGGGVRCFIWKEVFGQNGEYKSRVCLDGINSCSIKDFYFATPETVGQFADLTDKSGNECYEEDFILAYRRDDTDKENPIKLKITYLNGCFMVGTCTTHEFYRLFQQDFERIGNSFDNPELLSEQGGK